VAVGFLLATKQFNLISQTNDCWRIIFGWTSAFNSWDTANRTFSQRERFRELYVPAENAAEASVVKGINIVPVTHFILLSIIFPARDTLAIFQVLMEIFCFTGEYLIDMSHIKGQQHAKRAWKLQQPADTTCF